MNPISSPTSTAFRPGHVWLDTSGVPINAHGAGFLWHEGVCYWFGEHKVAGEAGNRAEVGVHVYASSDLLNWSDQGIALAVSDDPTSELVRGCILERPKVIYNRHTRQFVMWFHLEPPGRGYAGARSGVAVADAPAGPYRFLHSLRPDAGAWPLNVTDDGRRPLDAAEEACLAAMVLPGGPVPYYPKNLLYRRDFADGQMARDQTLFVEDDGTAYQIRASEENGTLHVSRLSDDYLRSAGSYRRFFPGRFHEAPAMTKWRGRYFLLTSDCTGWAPNAARLAVASAIEGPWKELGNPCLGSGAQTANSFESQPAFILPVPGRRDAFIYVADRWRPENAIDGRYVWLPLRFLHGVPVIEWHDEWDLSFFDRPDLIVP